MPAAVVAGAVSAAIAGWYWRWLRVPVILLAAGWFGAAILRVATAGVDGANIGGGIAITFGGPILVGLIVWAVFSSRSILRD